MHEGVSNTSNAESYNTLLLKSSTCCTTLPKGSCTEVNIQFPMETKLMKNNFQKPRRTKTMGNYNNYSSPPQIKFDKLHLYSKQIFRKLLQEFYYLSVLQTMFTIECKKRKLEKLQSDYIRPNIFLWTAPAILGYVTLVSRCCCEKKVNLDIFASFSSKRTPLSANHTFSVTLDTKEMAKPIRTDLPTRPKLNKEIKTVYKFF